MTEESQRRSEGRSSSMGSAGSVRGRPLLPLGGGIHRRGRRRQIAIGYPASSGDDRAYMHARFYSALTGRFLELDSVDSTMTRLPQTLTGLSKRVEDVDSETGAHVYVKGDRVVITNEKGAEITRYTQSRAKTLKRVQGGK